MFIMPKNHSYTKLCTTTPSCFRQHIKHKTQSLREEIITSGQTNKETYFHATVLVKKLNCALYWLINFDV